MSADGRTVVVSLAWVVIVPSSDRFEKYERATPGGTSKDVHVNLQFNPGRVFHLELPFDDAAEAYLAVDERRAIKAFLRF